MRRFAVLLLACLATLAAPFAGAQTGGAALVEARAVPVPHLLVMRDQQWSADASGGADAAALLAGGGPDFALLPAARALELRRSGADAKVVYVVARRHGDYQVLTVSERLLSSEPARVEALVGLFEKARRWIGANPEAAAALFGAARGVAPEVAQAEWASFDFNVARPGPALIQALRAGGADAQTVAALVDDGPVRAAVRRLERPEAPTLISRK